MNKSIPSNLIGEKVGKYYLTNPILKEIISQSYEYFYKKKDNGSNEKNDILKLLKQSLYCLMLLDLAVFFKISSSFSLDVILMVLKDGIKFYPLILIGVIVSFYINENFR